MKIIVTDKSDLRVIIYNISKKRIDMLLNDENDLSEVIEELLSEYHHSLEINWMVLEDDFTIEKFDL
jgi:hypothetical protein